MNAYPVRGTRSWEDAEDAAERERERRAPRPDPAKIAADNAAWDRAIAAMRADLPAAIEGNVA